MSFIMFGSQRMFIPDIQTYNPKLNNIKQVLTPAACNCLKLVNSRTILIPEPATWLPIIKVQLANGNYGFQWLGDPEISAELFPDIYENIAELSKIGTEGITATKFTRMPEAMIERGMQQVMFSLMRMTPCGKVIARENDHLELIPKCAALALGTCQPRYFAAQGKLDPTVTIVPVSTNGNHIH